MTLRETRVKDFGIDTNRYRELTNFCRQYPAWEKMINTNQNDEDNEPYKNCKLIIETAKETSDLWEYIIDNVCYQKSIMYLISSENIPCSKRTYSDIKKRFFILLHSKI